MKLKEGRTNKEAFDVIMHDLECLDLKKSLDNTYHYDLLKGNLEDLFGAKRRWTKKK